MHSDSSGNPGERFFCFWDGIGRVYARYGGETMYVRTSPGRYYGWMDGVSRSECSCGAGADADADGIRPRLRMCMHVLSS